MTRNVRPNSGCVGSCTVTSSAEDSSDSVEGIFRYAFALRDRLAASAGNLASDLGRVTVWGLAAACEAWFCRAVTRRFAPLPADLASAHALILTERTARIEAEATAARALAVNTSTEALIAHMKAGDREAAPLGFRQSLGAQGAAA